MDSDIHLGDASNGVVAHEEVADIVRSPSWVLLSAVGQGQHSLLCDKRPYARTLIVFPIVNRCG